MIGEVVIASICMAIGLCLGLYIARNHSSLVAGRIAWGQHRRQESSKSQELYRNLLANLPDLVIFLLDSDLRLQMAGGLGLVAANFDRESVEGKTIWQLMPAETCELLKQKSQRALAGEATTCQLSLKEQLYQVQLIRAIESQSDIWMVMLPTDNRERENSQDICMGERQCTAEKLLANNSILRAVIDATGDGIYVKDIQGRYELINSAGAKPIGRPIAEIIGKDDRELFPRAIAEKRQQSDLEILATGSSTVEEIVPVGYELRTYSTKKGVYRDPSGAIVGLVGIARDITERKQMEEALRKSEAELRAFFAAMTDAILVLNRYGRYLKIAPTNPRLLYQDESELLGKNFYEVFDIDKADFFVAHIQEALDKNQTVQVEYSLPIAGKQVWFAASISPLSADSVVWVARDITEQKQAVDAIRTLNALLEQRVADRTRSLAAANKELEAFSYSVSHDLRSPLRRINGFSRILLEDYAKALDANGQHYLQRILAATERMGQMIDDLLTLSRLTRSQICYESVNLSAIAQTVIRELQAGDRHRQVQIAIDQNIIADGDPRLLQLVLENLLGNAWKYTLEQPQPLIEFGINTENNQSVYFIRDNGAGFDMAYADKLFAPFQRLHSATEFEGTGIGLATVQRIVRRHGGQVWAEAAINQGATFYFSLPNAAPGNDKG